jgi:membrane-associated phospholipid phosphatase
VRRAWPRVARPRQLVALTTAASCALGLVAVGLVAVRAGGYERDATVLHGFADLYRRRADAGLEAIAHAVNPLPYALLGMLCVAAALARRRGWRAVAVGVVLIGSGLTTQALKHLLAEPRYTPWLGFDQIDEASWPSGHATAAMALALCAVIAVAPRLRTVTALVGGAGAICVSYATLVLAWHYPSDVLAGLLVAGLWVALAQAALVRLEDDDEGTLLRGPPAALLGIGGAGAMGAAAVVGLAPERGALYPGERVTVFAGALVLAGVVLALLVATVTADPEWAERDGRGASTPQRRPPTGSAEDGRTPRAAHDRAERVDSPPRRTPARGRSPGRS